MNIPQKTFERQGQRGSISAPPPNRPGRYRREAPGPFSSFFPPASILMRRSLPVGQARLPSTLLLRDSCPRNRSPRSPERKGQFRILNSAPVFPLRKASRLSRRRWDEWSRGPRSWRLKYISERQSRKQSGDLRGDRREKTIPGHSFPILSTFFDNTPRVSA